MTDKSELKLAEGSRWATSKFDDFIVDANNACVETHGDELLVDGSECKFPDALAAIRAVDGDPEYLELVRLCARNCRLESMFRRIGYSEEEIERIATGNDIESDHCCPQALEERRKLDELRAENEALVARCESLHNDLDERKSWLEDAQRERDYFEELANNAGVT